MTIEFQWFGPLSIFLTIVLVSAGFLIGKKKGGWIGAAISLVLMVVAYSMLGTYSPKLAIDSTPIQDIRREKSEITPTPTPDYEPRFEERVEDSKRESLGNPK